MSDRSMPEPLDLGFVRELKFSTTPGHNIPVRKVLPQRLLRKQSAWIHFHGNVGLNFFQVVDICPASAEISNASH